MRAILFTMLATAGILSNTMTARDANAAMLLGARPSVATAQPQPGKYVDVSRPLPRFARRPLAHLSDLKRDQVEAYWFDEITE